MWVHTHTTKPKKYLEKKQNIRLDCAQRVLLTCTFPKAELNCSSAVACRVFAMVTASPPRSTCRSCPAWVSRIALLSLVKPLMTMMASPAMTDVFLCWKIKRERGQGDKVSRTSLQQVSHHLRVHSTSLGNSVLLWQAATMGACLQPRQHPGQPEWQLLSWSYQERGTVLVLMS